MVNDSDPIPAMARSCIDCGHTGSTPAELEHDCPVAAAFNGAMVAMAAAIACIVFLAVRFLH